MAAEPMAAAARPGGAEVIRALRVVGFAAIGGLALLGYLVVVGEAHLDASTVALVCVGGALLVCLRSMFRIVQALGRADVHTVVEQAGDIGIGTDRELREEKRRLLRAINELRFDHEMGKLSKEDYDVVRQGFELRAIEVMRALDAGAGLHPELEAALARVSAGKAASEGKTDAEGKAASEAEVASDDKIVNTTEIATRVCAACDGVNDADARFCKHCGKELAA